MKKFITNKGKIIRSKELKRSVNAIKNEFKKPESDWNLFLLDREIGGSL